MRSSCIPALVRAVAVSSCRHVSVSRSRNEPITSGSRDLRATTQMVFGFGPVARDYWVCPSLATVREERPRKVLVMPNVHVLTGAGENPAYPVVRKIGVAD